MATAKGLTDAALKNTKPRAKPFKIYDRDRLYALVSVAGTKRWYWSYRLGGKDVAVPLGRYPDVSIKEARALRDEAAKLVEKGEHPKAHKEAVIAQMKAEQANTLWPVVEEWLAKMKPTWGAHHAAKVEALLVRYLKTGLGERPIAEVQTGDVYALISGVAVRKRINTDAGERRPQAPHNAVMLR
ncbi:MAG: Arm DNA-binding domain-containing protein, partial [Paraburkholderia sp.]